MTENEFLLQDRLAKIKSTIDKYGEENFYLSFSGGKDSTVLSALLDMACPENKIPRVYANTGIEYKMIFDFVSKKAEVDNRIVILKPTKNIRQMLEEEGYPFKSKQHAKWVDMFQRNGRTQSIENYLQSEKADKTLYRPCPNCLKYQFSDDFRMRISDKCCLNMKEKPIDNWAKENDKKHGVVGVMREEGGRRMGAECLAFRGGELWHFQPLVPVTKEWEDWFIDTYNVEICDIYKPPYNFERTGCKGCPFALHLQKELDTLEKFFPAERKQCELIWKPVYDEYRRLGYRLRKEGEGKQITIEEVINDE